METIVNFESPPSPAGEEGCLRWMDLAATAGSRATAFYRALFGWTAQPHTAGAGIYTILGNAGTEVGSIYQLSDGMILGGVPSHWTPYVTVNCLDQTRDRAVGLGARIVVREFPVRGRARIALIIDPVGALLGLWEPLKNRES